MLGAFGRRDMILFTKVRKESSECREYTALPFGIRVGRRLLKRTCSGKIQNSAWRSPDGAALCAQQPGLGVCLDSGCISFRVFGVFAEAEYLLLLLLTKLQGGRVMVDLTMESI